MTNTKTVTAFYFLMGLLSLCGCTGKSNRMNKSELDYISFKELSKKAYAYLNKQQDSCDQLYKISTYEHWFYEQATGELTFSDSGVNKVIIDYEEVGSVSFKSNTWLWAWGNPHLDEKIKAEIVKVRDYGFRRSFNKLTNPKWTADEYDGWEMTAIAAYLMKAKGAYRIPSSDSSLYSYMIYKNVRWADTVQPANTASR